MRALVELGWPQTDRKRRLSRVRQDLGKKWQHRVGKLIAETPAVHLIPGAVEAGVGWWLTEIFREGCDQRLEISWWCLENAVELETGGVGERHPPAIDQDRAAANAHRRQDMHTGHPAEAAAGYDDGMSIVVITREGDPAEDEA